jgi:hypothetical protein
MEAPGGRSNHLVSDLKGKERILETGRGKTNRTLQRTCFGKGYGSVVRQTTELILRSP